MKGLIKKRSRFEARLTQRQRELFEKAAALQGRTLSEFVVDAALHQAEEVLARHNLITLSAEDYELVTEMLRNPGEPNEELKNAVKIYRKLVQRNSSSMSSSDHESRD